MSKVNIKMIGMSVNDLLGGQVDEDRDRLRDFMSFMDMSYDEDKHQHLYKEKIDEVEYYKRVFKYYIYDSIKNHHLISLLIDDREGKLEKPISDMSIDEFFGLIDNKTKRDYNNRVLGKGLVNDKIEFNTKF